MTMDMIGRAAVASAAIKRFRHAPLVLGTTDCVRLGAFVLRERGKSAGLAKVGDYRTVIGAKRALGRLGFETLEQAVDAIGLTRIPPRAALAADLVMVPGEAFGGALTMAVGNGRVLGWVEGVHGAEILQPTAYIAAWRL